MKIYLFILLLVLTASPSFCQKHPYWYDSLVSTYNYLNNDPFPELQLEDTSGNITSTSSLLGKTVYVDFWFTTCPPCIKEIPYYKDLQQHFKIDTNVIFLSICIENAERKTAWKEMIKEKELPGVHLFYARNRPQKINLLRKFNISFPTYLLLNKEMKVIGYNAPHPSETGWVHWSIIKAREGKRLSASYAEVVKKSKEYIDFISSLENKADHLKENKR